MTELQDPEAKEPLVWIATRPNMQLKLTVEGQEVTDLIREYVQSVMEAYMYELKRHLKGLRP